MHRGRIGSGETSAMAYAIPRTSIEYWRARLTDLDIPFEETNLRFDDPVISLADPDEWLWSSWQLMILRLFNSEGRPHSRGACASRIS